MYNFHAHTFISDGALLPSEVAVRYQAAGYKAIAITDHADYSNIESAVDSVVKFCRNWPKDSGIKVLPGVELTHVPPKQFKPLARYARAKGIKVIIAHGETPMEPVTPGTNRAALEADIDILAHPGNITEEDAKLAAARGIFLEVTSRKGHREANRYVVEAARKAGAKIILNNDSHEPEDIISPEKLAQAGIDAGLNRQEIEEIYKEAEMFLDKKDTRR